MADNNIRDNIVKGSFVLTMCSDGDFTVTDIEGLKENGWHVVSDEDSYDYTISLYDFIGTGYELKGRINEVFVRMHSSRIYIMREICDIFDSIECNCVADKTLPNMYFDHGNQTYEANFNFIPAGKADAIKREIAHAESRVNYFNQQIKEYTEYADMYKKQIEELKLNLQEVAE